MNDSFNRAAHQAVGQTSEAGDAMAVRSLAGVQIAGKRTSWSVSWLVLVGPQLSHGPSGGACLVTGCDVHDTAFAIDRRAWVSNAWRFKGLRADADRARKARE